MDMIREQRVVIEGLRGDLKAALREAGYIRRMNEDLFDHLNDWKGRWDKSQAEVKHQAELACRLTVWMCQHECAKEAAEIVGQEAVSAILAALPAVDKCYD